MSEELKSSLLQPVDMTRLTRIAAGRSADILEATRRVLAGDYAAFSEHVVPKYDPMSGLLLPPDCSRQGEIAELALRYWRELDK